MIEILGWYLLTLSFVWALSLLSLFLSLALNFIYGSLLLLYYYTNDHFRTKERFWTATDEFLSDNGLSFAVVSVHRARDCSQGSEHAAKDLWHIELAKGPSIPSSKAPVARAAVEKQISHDDFLARLKAVCK
jgi:hypothetical protein